MRRIGQLLMSTVLVTGCAGLATNNESLQVLLERKAAAQPRLSPYEEGKRQLQFGNPGLAIDAFQAALREAPDSILALNGIAVAYDRLGRADVAQRFLDQALTVDANSAVTLNNLAYLNLVRGNTAVALAYAERAKIAAALPRGMMLPDTISKTVSRNVEIAIRLAASETKDPAVADVQGLPPDRDVKRVGLNEWQLRIRPPSAETSVAINAPVPQPMATSPVVETAPPVLLTSELPEGLMTELLAPPEPAVQQVEPVIAALEAPLAAAALGPAPAPLVAAAEDPAPPEPDALARSEPALQTVEMVVAALDTPVIVEPWESTLLTAAVPGSEPTASVAMPGPTAVIAPEPSPVVREPVLASLQTAAAADASVMALVLPQVADDPGPQAPEAETTSPLDADRRETFAPVSDIPDTVVSLLLEPTAPLLAPQVVALEVAPEPAPIKTQLADHVPLPSDEMPVRAPEPPLVLPKAVPAAVAGEPRSILPAVLALPAPLPPAPPPPDAILTPEPTRMVAEYLPPAAEPAYSPPDDSRAAIASVLPPPNPPSAPLPMAPLVAPVSPPPQPEPLPPPAAPRIVAALRPPQLSAPWRASVPISTDIRVSNGTGRRLMASRFARYFGEHGLGARKIANANSFDYRRTVIFYNPDQRSHAEALAAVLPFPVRLAEAKRGRGQIELILGFDLIGLDDSLRSV
jgi:hypothetical protein